MKVSEATNRQLDWLVLIAMGYRPAKREKRPWGFALALAPQKEYSTIVLHKDTELSLTYGAFYPTEDWGEGGTIIEREGIGLLFCSGSACSKPVWFATPDDQCTQTSYEGEYMEPSFLVNEGVGCYGYTPLTAAMRCYVVSKLGEEVDIPKELL